MALTEKREEAERLYVRKFMSCAAAAAELGINEGTVYRWKAKAAAEGENEDWDVKREKLHLSPQEFIEIYVDVVKDAVLQLKANPPSVWNPGIADSMTKHFANIRRLDIRGQYMSVAVDLVRIINRWLADNQPELQERMVPCWDGIKQAIADYATRKDLPWNAK
jgi:hypothetical protein